MTPQQYANNLRTLEEIGHSSGVVYAYHVLESRDLDTLKGLNSTSKMAWRSFRLGRVPTKELNIISGYSVGVFISEEFAMFTAVSGPVEEAPAQAFFYGFTEGIYTVIQEAQR